jgi:hypothetical protein
MTKAKSFLSTKKYSMNSFCENYGAAGCVNYDVPRFACGHP